MELVVRSCCLLQAIVKLSDSVLAFECSILDWKAAPFYGPHFPLWTSLSLSLARVSAFRSGRGYAFGESQGGCDPVLVYASLSPAFGPDLGRGQVRLR